MLKCCNVSKPKGILTGFSVIGKTGCKIVFHLNIKFEVHYIHINIEPIGIIKKAGKYTEILIYSDFEQVVKNTISKLGKSVENGQKLLIIHKNNDQNDGHQVQVTKTALIERAGNVLKVGKINANDDSVIDVRLDFDEPVMSK